MLELVNKSMDHLLLILVLILIFFIVCGNLCTILVFIRNNKLRSNPSYCYVTVLAVFDLLTGIVLVPLEFITTQVLYPPPDVLCIFYFFGISFIGHFQITILLILSVDRYLRISSSSFNRYGRLRKKTFLKVFGIICLSSLILASALSLIQHETDKQMSCISVYFYKRNDNEYLSFSTEPFLFSFAFILTMSNGFLPFVVMTFFNFKVHQICLKYTKLIHSLQKNQENDDVINNKSTIEIDIQSERVVVTPLPPNPSVVDLRRGKSLQRWTKELILEKKILLIIFAFDVTSFVTVLPPCTVFVLHNFMNVQISTFTYRLFLPWFWYLNAFLDPIILMLSCKEFRSGLLSMINK